MTGQTVILCVSIVAFVAWRAITAWERVHTARLIDPWKADDDVR